MVKRVKTLGLKIKQNVNINNSILIITPSSVLNKLKITFQLRSCIESKKHIVYY